MTPEQQKALALARSRRRRAEAQSGTVGGKTDRLQANFEREADAAEAITGTGTFADLTGAGIAKAVPFGDEIASGLNAPFRAAREWWQGDGFDVGRAYDRNMRVEEELQRRRDERSPVASTAGAVAGGLGASAPLAAGGLSFLNGAKPTLASMAGRGAAEGAAYGAAYGAGEGRGVEDRSKNAVYSSIIGLLTGGATGALGSIGAGKVDLAGLPTADDLRAASQAAYQRADDAGVIYTKESLQRVRDQLRNEFTEFGYHPELQSGAKVALGEVARIAEDNATLKGLDTARKVAGNAFQPGNTSNNALSAKVTGAIDDLVASPRPGDVLMGDGAVAADAIKEARSLYRQAAKLDTMNSLLDRAGRRAGASYSGGNIENASRQELNKILNSERLKRGFTKAEQDAVRKAVVGTPGQNAMRLAGKLSPEGGGIMSMLHILGAGGTGGATLPLAAVGMAAKRGSDAMTANNIRMAEALIASGGKLPSPQLSALRQAIVEALTRGGALAPQ